MFLDLINIELNKTFDERETVTTMKCSNNRKHDLLDIFKVHKNNSDLVCKAGTYLWQDWSPFYRGIQTFESTEDGLRREGHQLVTDLLQRVFGGTLRVSIVNVSHLHHPIVQHAWKTNYCSTCLVNKLEEL